MIPVNEPSDGWDGMEKLLLREIVITMYRNVIVPVRVIPVNEQTAFLYQKAIRRLENAFIIMAINELGYTQQEVARILDISQVAVQKRLKKTHEKIRETQGV